MTERIGDRILQGIREINAGKTAYPPAEPITAENVEAFLLSFRGLALSFWAMNEEWCATHRRTCRVDDYFEVSDREWRREREETAEPDVRITDCHTHYMETGGSHPAPQYRQQAHGHWWFFPRAFDFTNGLANCPLAHPVGNVPLHDKTQYRRYFAEACLAYKKQFKFFVTPAPGAIASHQDMASVCDLVNHDVNYAAGYAFGPLWRSLGAIPTPDLQGNPSRLWKVYPTDSWDVANIKWLVSDQSFINALNVLNQAGRPQTLCIHWWDDDAPPSGWQIHEATWNSLAAMAAAFDKVRFVIFHGCFSPSGNHEKLADMLGANLFAEIGGVFANMILGQRGTDGIDNSGSIGPEAARSFVNRLRGCRAEADGSFANDKHILWGTDAIWHGSPIWQVEAFKRLILTNDPAHDRRFKAQVFEGNPRTAFSVL